MDGVPVSCAAVRRGRSTTLSSVFQRTSKHVTLPLRNKSGLVPMRTAVFASSWCTHFSARLLDVQRTIGVQQARSSFALMRAVSTRTWNSARGKSHVVTCQQNAHAWTRLFISQGFGKCLAYVRRSKFHSEFVGFLRSLHEVRKMNIPRELYIYMYMYVHTRTC